MAMTIADYEQNGSDAERALIKACREGKACKLGKLPAESGEAPTVRAELIRFLALEATSLHEAGVWLEGARITAQLDLRFAKCRGGFVFHECRFEQRPVLQQVELSVLSLEGSHIPGLSAQRANLAGSMALRNLQATGAVILTGAKIGGQFNCNGATLNGDGDEALNAQGVRVTEDMFLRNLTATVTVDVYGAQIGGQLDCEGATLNGDGGNALNGQSLRVEQGFFFRRVKSVTGNIALASAHAGDLGSGPIKLVL